MIFIIGIVCLLNVLLTAYYIDTKEWAWALFNLILLYYNSRILDRLREEQQEKGE